MRAASLLFIAGCTTLLFIAGCYKYLSSNMYISIWLGIGIFTILLVSNMLIHKRELINYPCSNNYWSRTDYQFNSAFFLDTYGEYKCFADSRYNNPASIVYYNELINIIISVALLLVIRRPALFRGLLLVQALNTIIYFMGLGDWSNLISRKGIFLGISALYIIYPALLFIYL